MYCELNEQFVDVLFPRFLLAVFSAIVRLLLSRCNLLFETEKQMVYSIIVSVSQ